MTMINQFFNMLGLLVFLHLLLDYALQGDFMAKAKNHTAQLPDVPWKTLLVSHCFMQAYAVYIVTESVIGFFMEFCSHLLTDYLKSSGKISFNMDQYIHVLTKVCIVLVVLTEQFYSTT